MTPKEREIEAREIEDQKAYDDALAAEKAAKAAADAKKAAEDEKKAQKAAGWPQVADMLIVLGQVRTDVADMYPGVTNSTEKMATPESIAAVRAAVPARPLSALQSRSAEVHARVLMSGAKGPALCLVTATLLIAHTRTVTNVPVFANEEDARAYHGAASTSTEPDGNLTAFLKKV